MKTITINEKSTECIVDALHCCLCGDIVYSRARHDYHTCTCGKVAIDGGPEYTKWIGGNPKDFTLLTLTVPASRAQLFQDWNTKIDKFGLIKCRLSRKRVIKEKE